MHFIKNIVIISILLNINFINAQEHKKVLFTVAGQPVFAKEFIKVFNKNRDIVSEENKKSIKEYLELYINYKLKLKQAYDLKYDTISSYKKELAQYRDQLIMPYLTDNKITNKLVKEAYNRSKLEISASHILIKLDQKASARDTLLAYHKIMEARNKILKGASFSDIAKQYSQDPSAQKNGGNLGYFTAFSMVYPFENVAYTTKKNEVSMPFRTQFGYHILRVNDIRNSKGEVEVAHIMIKENKNDSLYAKTKIDELYSKLKQGERFEMLAQRYSDDKNSAINGGKLAKFNATRMIKKFADVAFSLKNINDISKPFRTIYGWHIVKLLKKYPIKDFKSVKNELTMKIEKSKRYNLAGTSVINRLIKEYKITKNQILSQAYFKRDTVIISKNLKNTIFSINGKNVKLNDLINYNIKHSNKDLINNYDDFLKLKVLDYYKKNLENTDQDFAFTLQEYRDGLLLFDLLQDKVWKRAEKDTVGLEKYFKKNRQNYLWKKRGDLIIAACTKKDKAILVKKYLEENKKIEEIKKLVNDGAIINVIFTEGVFEENDNKLPEGFKLTNKMVSDVIIEKDSNFVVIKTNNIMASKPMTLSEARGRVINDYQVYLDKQWIAELRKQYPVKVRQRVLKKLIKENQG